MILFLVSGLGTAGGLEGRGGLSGALLRVGSWGLAGTDGQDVRWAGKLGRGGADGRGGTVGLGLAGAAVLCVCDGFLTGGGALPLLVALFTDVAR